MAGDKLGLADQVRRADRLGSKAQVRDGDRAGFLRVVDEVTLGVVVGFFTDDLDRVLVGAHCTISTQTPEYTADGLGGFDVEGRIEIQAGVGDIIVDADR